MNKNTRALLCLVLSFHIIISTLSHSLLSLPPTLLFLLSSATKESLPPTIQCYNMSATLNPESSFVFFEDYLHPLVTDNADCASRLSWPSTGPFHVGTTELQVTATNSRGNNASCKVFVDVIDPFPPEIVCPSSLDRVSWIVPTDVGKNYATVNCLQSNGRAFNTELCPGGFVYDAVGISTLQQLPSFDVLFGSQKLTFVATDVAGNQASCTSQIVVIDTEPPQVHCPSDIIATESAVSLSSVITFVVSGSDNVALANVLLTLTNGTRLLDWSLASDIGNSNSEPVSPLPLSGLSDPGVTVQSDQSMIVSVTAQRSVSMLAGTNVTLILVAVDESGNTNRCSFNISVEESAVTHSLLEVESLVGNVVIVAAVSNISTEAENMTALQAGLLANLVSSVVEFSNVSSSAVFLSLNNLGNLPPTALQLPSSVNSFGESAQKIRNAIYSFASIESELIGNISYISNKNNSNNRTSDGGIVKVYNGSTLTIQTVTTFVDSLIPFNFTGQTNHHASTWISIPPSVVHVTNSTSESTLVSALFTFFHDDRFFPRNGSSSNASTSTGTVVSPVVDITLSGATLQGPLSFSFVPADFSPDGNYRCMFWVTDTNSWSELGMVTSVTAAGVECVTTHLTNFAVLVVRILVSTES